MRAWTEVPLSAIGKLSSGKAIKPGLEGPFNAFGSNGVIGGAPEPRHACGVIVGRVGAYCGSVALSRVPFWASDNTIVVEPIDRTDLDFLFYLLLHADLNQHAGGAAQPLVTQGSLKSLSFRVPELAARARIAAVLRPLDDLVEINRRRVEVLEQMARAIYREWFVHFRYPGHEDATFVDSDLGLIPDGWDVVGLGSVAEAERLTVHPKHDPDAYFDHYSIPAFDDGQLPFVEAGETIRSGKYAVTQPAIMVSKLNPRIPRTWFVEPSGGRAVASTEFVILRPKGERSLDWTYATVTSPQFEDRMTQLSGGTSGSHQRLRPGDMLAIAVLDPPTELIRRTTDAIQPALAMARRLRHQAKELGAIRDMLLPKLVTGQIDVSELDLDAVVGSVA